MSSDHLDITRHGFVLDNITGDRAFEIETIIVEGTTTTRTIGDPLGLVDGVTRQSTSKRVAFWELQAVIDHETVQVRLRAIPEARRRQEDRRIAQAQRAPCASCNGTGWIEDAARGRGYECPACRD